MANRYNTTTATDRMINDRPTPFLAGMLFSWLLLLARHDFVIVDAFSLGSIPKARTNNNTNNAISRFATSTDVVSNFAQETTNSQKTVVIVGATGYIGRAVVKESVQRGYHTVALVRDISRLQTQEGQAAYKDYFRGATVVECNVQDNHAVQHTLSSLSPQVDTLISCLASPSGTKKDAYAIDYQATLNCLTAARNIKARHFVLLSAFCCRNPTLQLQQAKLKMEAQLQAQSDLTFSIVRPTAFFKSVSGQLEAIQSGAPYVLFDDGAATRCNPIAESELAEYMMNTLIQQDMHNKILNVGGPDEPLTNKDLGEVRKLTLQWKQSLLHTHYMHILVDDVSSDWPRTKVCVRTDMDIRSYYTNDTIFRYTTQVGSFGGCRRNGKNWQILCSRGYVDYRPGRKIRNHYHSRSLQSHRRQGAGPIYAHVSYGLESLFCAQRKYHSGNCHL